KTLYQALALGVAQVVVLHGQVEQILQRWLHRSPTPPIEAVPGPLAPEEQQTVTALGQEALRERASAYFKKQLATVIKLPAQRIDMEAPLSDYGFDSIMAVGFTSALEGSFGPLSKTLLFEYPTVRSVTDYFLHRYPEQLRRVLGMEEATVTALPQVT